MTKHKPISQILAEKTFRELGLDPKTGKPLASRKPPVNSHNIPFRIPALEKTKRQAVSTQGYKASATWQTASLLRDLLTLWFEFYTPKFTSQSPVDIPLFSRLKSQVLDAMRGVVSTFEEGWARPSSKEFLDFIGFSQASLAEIRGNVERMLTDGLMQSSHNSPSAPITSRPPNSEMERLGIPTPSHSNPYPPIKVRKDPGKYGNLRDKLREFTGKNLDPQDFTYELFLELINKVDYLLKRSVEGLRARIISQEKKKFNDEIGNHWRKVW